MKRIKVYNDIGVSDECIKHTLFSLRKIVPDNMSIELLSAADILNTNILNETDLLILPGGADLKFIEKLQGEGDARIRNFIKNGGSYFAICAGAYYSSNYCEFAKGTDLEVCGQRELAIFPGTSRGPTLAAYEYNSNSGARAAKIMVKGLSSSECFVFYNGGGSFLNAAKVSNVEILALYENYEAAIIRVNYGHGIAILSGVHPEYDPEIIKFTIPYSGLEKLQEHDSDRVHLLRSLLNTLGVV